jgi:transcriptional regulator GlxA family with amidase domain
MKKVAILVPESAVLQAIADPQYCFQAVNQFLSASGRTPLFELTLVGAQKEVSFNEGMYTVHTHQLLSSPDHFDLVIIPALFGDLPRAIELNRSVAPWIVEQYRRGADVASLCVGAFLLASTGLLNGKKASTHWGFADHFKAMFPQVLLQDGHVVTEEEHIYTSGGANSYWNLLLHLVEKYVDRETAVLTAKYFAIDISRSSQSVFAMFRGQKGHTDHAVKEVQQYIESHLDERLTVDELAEQVSVGRRSFERRFKRATGNSVLEYIQRVKIEAAKRSFECEEKNVNEVMQDLGYNDTKAFRTTFKRITGLTPHDYRTKYSKLKSA